MLIYAHLWHIVLTDKLHPLFLKEMLSKTLKLISQCLQYTETCYFNTDW